MDSYSAYSYQLILANNNKINDSDEAQSNHQ